MPQQSTLFTTPLHHLLFQSNLNYINRPLHYKLNFNGDFTNADRLTEHYIAW